ncbi:MAG TPA: DUF2782 domain-containing protein [Gammaproteobacteria bacterium]|nr:DUF2782 domain-containing protein [Gammaproteobacteria bacterium]
MSRHFISILLVPWMFLAAMPFRVAAEEAPPPPSAGMEEAPEPEVTIIHKRGETIEEYRINGRLYMIKVTPRKGIPYYLVDNDGDGNFEVRSNELDEEMLVPQWTILRW